MTNKLIQNMDLTYMRAEAQKAMPDKVTIRRKSLASDKQGGYTEAWNDAYQDIPARLSIQPGGETLTEGRQDPQPKAVLTLAYNQSVEQTDRVIHASGTYEILFVNAGKSWSLGTQCQMRRL